MKTIQTIAELQVFLREKCKSGHTIGLVPTMGALHAGHLSLVDQSVQDNEVTVATIFVNPTQFNSEEDFEKYPISLEEDLAMLKAHHVDAVFIPHVEEMYDQDIQLGFTLGKMEEVMEGRFRPGHFNGVALIVSKLFIIVRPDRAYFGQKDFQQFAIIQRLNTELRFGIELHCLPIIREDNGLAMSSRNRRLTKEGLERAGTIFKVLEYTKELLLGGEVISNIQDKGKKLLAEAQVECEYLEIVNAENLKAFDSKPPSGKAAICVAAYVEGVRLIDNTLVPL